MTNLYYVKSNYPRREEDFYETVDRRCVHGFLEHFVPAVKCIDVCSPSGSGIVRELNRLGYSAEGISDAFSDDLENCWIVTNPPYSRNLVDKIIYRQIDRISRGEVELVACLLRSNFPYAKSRVGMFSNNPYYYGEIKLMFRPYWSEERKRQPIHNYAWQIWKKPDNSTSSRRLPVVMFSNGFVPHKENGYEPLSQNSVGV